MTQRSCGRRPGGDSLLISSVRCLSYNKTCRPNRKSKPIKRRVKVRVKKRSALSSVPASIVSSLRAVAEAEKDSVYWSGGSIDN
jgi:hypothetical protein